MTALETWIEMVKTYLFDGGELWEERENDMTMEIEFTLYIMRWDGE